jgi:hemoglobin
MRRSVHACVAALPLAAAVAIAVLSGGPTAAHAADDALYKALGGRETIARFAAETIDLALADDRIKDTFSESNIPRIKEKLAEQFCMLAGGPCTYTGIAIRKTHPPLKITNAQFNAMVEDLQTAMEHAGVPYRAQNKLLHLLAPMQRDIVTR